jgi:hypothetical protein
MIMILFVYFLANSSFLLKRIEPVLRSALPGRIEIEKMQVMPIPSNIRLHNVRIFTPENSEIIYANYIDVNMDIFALLGSLVLPSDASSPVDLTFRRIKLSGFHADLIFDRNNDFLFLNAFVPKEEIMPETTAPGRPVRLNFKEIRGEGGSCLIDFPEFDMLYSGINMEVKLSLDKNGNLTLSVPELEVSEGVSHIKTVNSIPPGISDIYRSGKIHVKDFSLTDRGFLFERVTASFDRLKLTAVDGQMRFPQDNKPLAFYGRAFIGVKKGQKDLEKMAMGLVQGDYDVVVNGNGDIENVQAGLQLTSPSLTVAGQIFTNVKLALIYQKDRTGNYRLDIPEIFLNSGNGSVKIKDTFFYPFGNSGEILKGDAEIEKISFQKILSEYGISTKMPVPDEVSGRLQFSAVKNESEQKIHLKSMPDLLVSFNSPEYRKYISSVQIKGGVEIEKSPGEFSILAKNLKIQSDEFQMLASGMIKPDTLQTDMDLKLNIYNLKNLLSINGITDISGDLNISSLRIKGKISNPDVRCLISSNEMSVYGIGIKSLSAGVSMSGKTVNFVNLRANTALGDLASDGKFAIAEKKDRTVLNFSFPEISLKRMNLKSIPFSSQLSGMADIDLRNVGFSTDSIIQSMSGSLYVKGEDISAGGELFEELSVEMDADSESFHMVEMKSGWAGGSIRANLKLNKDLKNIEGELNLSRVNLSKISAVGKIPLKGEINVDADISGNLPQPDIKSRIELNSFAYDFMELGNAEIVFMKNADKDGEIRSPKFFKNMFLNESSRLNFSRGIPEKLILSIHLSKLDISEILKDYFPKDISGIITCDTEIAVDFSGKGRPFDFSVTLPDEGLKVSLLDGSLRFRSKGNSQVQFNDRGLNVTELVINDGSRNIYICGGMNEQGIVDAYVSGYINLEILKYFKSVISSAKGYLHTETIQSQFPSCMSTGDEKTGFLAVKGRNADMTITGKLALMSGGLIIRNFPQEFQLDQGGVIYFEPSGEQEGRTLVSIREDAPLTGKMGEGSFSLRGNMILYHFIPEQGNIFLSGNDLYFSMPREYFLTFAPAIRFEFSNPGSSERKMRLSGDVLITEGSYFKNFDIFKKAMGAFQTAGGFGERKTERTGKSLIEQMPALAEMDLNIHVRGSNFSVKSRFPFGLTDLILDMDLALQGKLKNPLLYDRITLVDGGKFIYNIVRREFELKQSYIDFSGDPAKPFLDITAITKVEYLPSPASSPGIGSSSVELVEVEITLKVSGEYPDSINIELTSNKGYDQKTLQMLVLTGKLPPEAGGQGDSGYSSSTIGFVGEDISKLLSKLIVFPFMDAVSLGITTTGGMSAEVMTKLGNRMRVQTQVIVGESEASQYSAGFDFKITDKLSLEGRIKAYEPVSENEAASRTYESKLRYRIPLD